MLNLASDTPPRWAEWACRDLAALLIDHAHLEKKAAGTAVTLLFRYPAEAALQDPLADLAQEELAHFRAVLAELERRDLRLGRQRASAYAGRLHTLVRGGEPERLVDTLLIAALIEARSCERFTLLVPALETRDPELASFYRELLASEARHHGVYLRLAETLDDAAAIRGRLAELAAEEAAVVEGLLRESERPGAPVRLHS